MSHYIAIFKQEGQISARPEYDFDGTYKEHVDFLLNTYPYFCWEDGSEVRVYQDYLLHDNFVLDGIYIGYRDTANPHWEFFEVIATNPDCFENCIEIYR